ncbi:ArsR/SmtB family transcription factor [Fundidesulfovibrio terrae]|uniref:ArsR/SmtB family transcription factor n=1 Tax=Fundidesulfovibrio terrae TaxID=2922866 RepID=UPI002435CD45|nr:metalloregulator ArsR/SmtB family transcription factor [Fundidesulfovibrio terrae]
MKSISQLFKALGDETRLRIVHLLSEGELCVCDLTHALGMPQSTVSRHLALLKNAAIVSDRRCKTWAYYRLSDEARPFVRDILAVLGKHLADSNQACIDLAALREYRSCSDRNCDQPATRGRKA